jgi:hypothetical protein
MTNIDVELDDQGNFTFTFLPQGSGMTKFTFMGIDQEVLSINAPANYTLTLTSTAEILQYVVAGPVTMESPGVFSFQSDLWAVSQQQAMITAVTAAGASSFGILINPSNVPVSVLLQPGGLVVDVKALPVGVDFDRLENTFTLLTAGNFVFDFWISPLQIQGPLSLSPESAPPPEFGYTVVDTHCYVASCNMEVYPEAQVFAFSFLVGVALDADPAQPPIRIDPTIINNPINQGPGSGGIDRNGFAVYARHPRAGRESLALR